MYVVNIKHLEKCLAQGKDFPNLVFNSSFKTNKVSAAHTPRLHEKTNS